MSQLIIFNCLCPFNLVVQAVLMSGNSQLHMLIMFSSHFP